MTLPCPNCAKEIEVEIESPRQARGECVDCGTVWIELEREYTGEERESDETL